MESLRPNSPRQPRLHLGSLDLNLLVSLQAIIEEVSVTQAARRANVSQSAMSHTLKRLRKLLGDPLLVRQGNVYELTRRAQELRDPLRTILLQTEALFADTSVDPSALAEVLRLKPAIPMVGRRVTRNTTIGEITVPEDAHAVLLLAAGNHDPRKYPNPNHFDVTRNPVAHLSSGPNLATSRRTQVSQG